MSQKIRAAVIQWLAQASGCSAVISGWRSVSPDAVRVPGFSVGAFVGDQGEGRQAVGCSSLSISMRKPFPLSWSAHVIVDFL